MVQNRTLGRGVAVLAALGLVAGALIVSPVGAAAPVTKKKVKKIATKVFNKKIGPATAPFLKKTDSVVAFQKDSTGGSTAAAQQTNSLSITAPFAGFLVISGQVDIDNDDGADQIMCLRPQVDGLNVVTGTGTGQAGGPTAAGEASCFEYEADPGDEATIGYTVVASVGAGAHTVTQAILNETGTPNYDWFNGGLTALFVPSGGVTSAPAPRGVAKPSHDE
jgi:hypothetical protein